MAVRNRGTVTERGQVTIPKHLRDRLGIRPGEVLEFSEAGEGLLTARKASPQSALDAAFGALELDRSTDELMAELRGVDDAD
ncbi:MAG: AbrB/MazE/SpoVT family DNA-binding domain-containing protein [Thermoleophilia bacterium]|nr:AbrB/MazE/SpoVT family DNA-binding domain-containing protein [Thermoleophilia bacterium]